MDTDCVDYDDYRRCLRDLAARQHCHADARADVAWLAREIAGKKSFSLLDVACGHGDMLRPSIVGPSGAALSHGLRAWISIPGATRAAREATDRRRIKFRTGDVFTIPAGRRLRFHHQLAIHPSSERRHGGEVHPLDGDKRAARLVHRRPAPPLVSVLRLRRPRMAGTLASLRPERWPHLDRAQLCPR